MTTPPATRTALVGTRKGLFVYDLDASCPTVAGTHFLGSPVSSVLCDVRDGAWYACLDHGHFGVKLHRSDDHGETWAELAYPAYPADAVYAGEPAATRLLWTLAAGHPSQPGVLWCGTIPGGLFRSDDCGQTGSSIVACGTTRRASNGSVAATTTPACTRSRSIRGQRIR